MRLATALVCLVAAAVPGTGQASGSPEVEALVAAAVQARMGAVRVRIEALRVRTSGTDQPSAAVPDAGSRVGGPMRFVLTVVDGQRGRRRVGSADARVFVEAACPRATRALRRGEIVGATDVVVATCDPGRVALDPLPAGPALVGVVTRRAIAEGGLVTAASVSAAPAVRSGEEVTTIVRHGALEARGRAVALENGALGGRVRVLVNRRSLRGRVVAAGAVEVLP
jgi:flagella basal body P-ring formation protein FlgA